MPAGAVASRRTSRAAVSTRSSLAELVAYTTKPARPALALPLAAPAPVTSSSHRPVHCTTCWPAYAVPLGGSSGSASVRTHALPFQSYRTRLGFSGSAGVTPACHACVSHAHSVAPPGSHTNDPIRLVLAAVVDAGYAAANPGSRGVEALGAVGSGSAAVVPTGDVAPTTAAIPRDASGSRKETYSCGDAPAPAVDGSGGGPT